MPDHDIAVSVRGLSKSYTIAHNAPKHTTIGEALVHTLKNPRRRLETETFWALKDVEFDIHKGDVVGIIGRNGAGKSTLLKVLSRITEPTVGQIDIYGRVGSLLEVGTGFHPELTGRENIFMNGAILGMSRREIDRHFDAIVEFAEVEQFLDTPVKRYSSGMYVRLAFAVAAHLNPEILIVDEVLAVGDAAFQKKCLGKMQDVAAKEGRTVLFVSHNMGAVTQLCRSAIYLEKGQVREYGDVDKVITSYYGQKKTNSSVLPIDPSQHLSNFGGTETIQLLDIARTDPAAGNFQFRWREPINLKLRFQVHKPIRNVTFGLGVSTQQGISVLGSHHDDWRDNDLSFDPGIYECVIELENHLRPGTYIMEIGAENVAGRSSLCIVQDALTFQVLETPVDDMAFNYGCHGVINGYGRWDFLQSDREDGLRSFVAGKTLAVS